MRCSATRSPGCSATVMRQQTASLALQWGLSESVMGCTRARGAPGRGCGVVAASMRPWRRKLAPPDGSSTYPLGTVGVPSKPRRTTL